MALGATGLPEDIERAAVCYPKGLIREKRNHCLEIIRSLELAGYDIPELRLVDKGTDSVLLGPARDDVVIKVRRLDGHRPLYEEGYIMLFISYRSRVALSPLVYKFNAHVIVMERIKGYLIKDAISVLRGDADEISKIACRCLLKAIELDSLGVDHGQLSRAHEHILIRWDNGDPVFIDFGDARMTTRPHNASSLWSYLFNRGMLSGLGALNSLEIARGLKRGDPDAIRAVREACSLYVGTIGQPRPGA